MREHGRCSQVVLPAPAGQLVPQRVVWDSRYGVIVIDVVGERVFVNGDLVEPAPR